MLNQVRPTTSNPNSDYARPRKRRGRPKKSRPSAQSDSSSEPKSDEQKQVDSTNKPKPKIIISKLPSSNQQSTLPTNAPTSSITLQTKRKGDLNSGKERPVVNIETSNDLVISKQSKRGEPLRRRANFRRSLGVAVEKIRKTQIVDKISVALI